MESTMSGDDKTIRALFAAYLANDREAVALTDAFRFTSPYDDAIDNAARQNGVFVSQSR
jgi:predicted metal-dependent phosphoesterase TrpH